MGKPMKLDEPTRNISWPSVARICVEIYLLKPLPTRVWIGTGGSKRFWQHMHYEDLPSCSSHCFKIGYDLHNCKKLDCMKPMAQIGTISKEEPQHTGLKEKREAREKKVTWVVKNNELEVIPQSVF